MSNTILVCSVCLILVISVLWNILRGLSKSRLRGIMVLSSAVLAVVGTLLFRVLFVSDKTLDTLIIPLLQDAVNSSELLDLLKLSDTLNSVLLNVSVSMVSPILCLLLFWLFSFLTWIAYLIVSLVRGRSMRKNSKKSELTHLRAGIWGAVQGLAIIIILLIPISAYVGMVPAVKDALQESDLLGDEEDTVIEILDTYVLPLQSNGVIKAYNAVGGSALSDAMLNFEVNDNEVELQEELGSVAKFAGNIMQLAETDISQYGSSEVKVFNAIADSFEDSDLLQTIAGEFIYGATDAWLNDLTFLGAEKPSFGENVDPIFGPFFDTLLNVLHLDARDYIALQKDFRTVAEMVSILADKGVFINMENTEDLLEILSSNGVIEDLVTSLGNNESMKILIPEITQMGMRAIATTLGIPEDVEAVYGEFMDDVTVALNDVRALPEEERAAALSETLTNAFDEAGIPIDTEIVECYAVSMVEDLLSADVENLTADDVQAFFAVYAMNMDEEQIVASKGGTTVGLSAGGALPLANSDLFAGTVYEGKSEEELKKSGAAVLAKVTKELVVLTVEEGEDFAAAAAVVLSENYSELLAEKPALMVTIMSIEVSKPIADTAISATAGLKSSTEMQTVKVTLADLSVNSAEAASKINSNTIAQEAEAIAAIFSAASELAKTGTENMDLTTVAGTVGTILDSLGSTASVGSEKTANLFTAVLQSETVRKTADLDMTTATQMAQKATTGENVNYTQTMGAVSQGVTVFTKLSDENAELTEEELIELIQNINPQTAGMIEVYVTSDRIMKYGVPEQYADTSSQLIAEIFSYMADTEMGEQAYQKEAKALNQILNVAISAKSHAQEKELFGGILPSATETVDIFMASEAISHSLRVAMLDSDGEVKEGKFDLFELGEKIPEESAEYTECVQAIQAYYANHRTENTRQTLNAISALLGVPVTFQ